ncbi:SseB family protein [Micromonospora echinaurantiaca]|uniref:SseB family protein n=1 Tax=Micromonospora echinaurantiaca TaxID=47857 RepID=UPI0037B9FD76
MTSPSWPEIVDRLRDTLARCDRDTDLELAAGPRRLHLLVRRETVRLHCPGYDEARLAALGWQRPPDGSAGWWYETPRTPERLDWLGMFVARTAAEVLTADPGALSCRALPPTPVPVPAARRPATAPAPPPPADLPVPPPGDRTAAVVGPDPTTGRAMVAGAGTPGGPDPAIEPTPAAGAGTTGRPDPPTPPAMAAGAGPAGRPDSSGTAERTVTDLLAEAAGRRDLPGYLGVLAAATVCVPLAAEPSPDADFPWTVATDPAGAPLLPVFTSPEVLTAFAGDGVPFVALACADLFADWPDRSWGLVVDPGTPQSVALAAPALAALLAANSPAG